MQKQTRLTTSIKTHRASTTTADWQTNNIGEGIRSRSSSRRKVEARGVFGSVLSGVWRTMIMTLESSESALKVTVWLLLLLLDIFYRTSFSLVLIYIITYHIDSLICVLEYVYLNVLLGNRRFSKNQRTQWATQKNSKTRAMGANQGKHINTTMAILHTGPLRFITHFKFNRSIKTRLCESEILIITQCYIIWIMLDLPGLWDLLIFIIIHFNKLSHV